MNADITNEAETSRELNAIERELRQLDDIEQEIRAIEIAETLERLMLAVPINDSDATLVLAHERFIDRARVAPLKAVLAAVSDELGEREAWKIALSAPLAHGHVWGVLFCDDGVRFFQMPVTPLMKGGAC